jgi:hypothetical protein
MNVLLGLMDATSNFGPDTSVDCAPIGAAANPVAKSAATKAAGEQALQTTRLIEFAVKRRSKAISPKVLGD